MRFFPGILLTYVYQSLAARFELLKAKSQNHSQWIIFYIDYFLGHLQEVRTWLLTHEASI